MAAELLQRDFGIQSSPDFSHRLRESCVSRRLMCAREQTQLSANDLAEPDRRTNTRISTLCSHLSMGASQKAAIVDHVVQSCSDEMSQ